MRTPIGARLQIELETEERRLNNEWFYKWHFIGKDGPVEIDGFDGRTIRYGGLKFSGTPRDVYWDTIQRYLRQKISVLFDQLEKDIVSYPPEVQRESIAESQALIGRFAAAIREEAIEKDRILRGNGFEFPKAVDMGRWDRAGLPEIRSRSEMLLKLVKEPSVSALMSSKKTTLYQECTEFWDKHRLIVGLVGLVSALLGLAVLF